jgi:hypothetical protein
MPFGIGKFDTSPKTNFDKGFSKNLDNGAFSHMKVVEEVIKIVKLDFIIRIHYGVDGVKDLNYIL